MMVSSSSTELFSPGQGSCGGCSLTVPLTCAKMRFGWLALARSPCSLLNSLKWLAYPLSFSTRLFDSRVDMPYSVQVYVLGRLKTTEG